MSWRDEPSRFDLPWAPPEPGGEGLNRTPGDPIAIKTRLGVLFGVPTDCVTIASSLTTAIFAITSQFGEDIVPLSSPHELDTPEWADRVQSRPTLVVERGIEFLDGPDRSCAAQAASEPDFFVIRQLDAFGIASEQMVAIIHAPQHSRHVALGLLLHRPSTPLQRVVETVLHPSRMPMIQARINLIKAERQRIAEALKIETPLTNHIILASADSAAFARNGVEALWQTNGSVDVPIGMPEDNDRLLAAMGVAVASRAPARRADVARDTKETRIVATVDLDRAEPVDIATGIGFYDHMLEQVARHGGFSLTLAAEGDLHIEAHHTIEDSALALGEALRQALGDRKGVARFGFVAPLDEAEAAVTLDLSGRPFVKFEGEFRRAMIGEYPTEMTAHVFRSLADAMRATIHVKVTGEDDHHKTEAAFKSFGRALRQAIRVEGDAIPSTKGVLA